MLLQERESSEEVGWCSRDRVCTSEEGLCSCRLRDWQGHEKSELIFCSVEEGSGGFGLGVDTETEVFALVLLGGLINALVSDGLNCFLEVIIGVAGVERRGDLFSCDIFSGMLLLLAFCRVSTACIWLSVSCKIFFASSCGSRAPAGPVLSSWDFTVLSVSVLDWSDSELLAFPFPFFCEDKLFCPTFGLVFFKSSAGALIGDVGELMLPFEETVEGHPCAEASPLPAEPLPRLCPEGNGSVSQSLPLCPKGSLLIIE